MRLSEVYASSQGEGPNVGRTTVFVRFGGCNLRCPGWPCDTQHAIDPAYRKEWKRHTVDELTDRVFKTAAMSGAQWITLTGGEPFLQPKSELEEFVDAALDQGLEVEAFSNGTLLYPDWAIEKVNFIMDWKLPGSGEDPFNANRITNLQKMQTFLRDTEETHYQVDQFGPQVKHAIKFVIKNEQDLYAAHSLWSLHVHTVGVVNVETFYGKVWDGDIEDKDLVAYVIKCGLPWRLNRQEHNYIWPANERGR